MERSIESLKAQPHWSCSALQCYLSCPMKYKFRYVDNAPIERTCSALPFGRAFHAVLSERALKGPSLYLCNFHLHPAPGPISLRIWMHRPTEAANR